MMDTTGRAHLSCTIRDVDSNLVRLREPPHANVFARAGELVQILNRLIQTNSLGNFLEEKRGLDFQGYGDEETGTPETTEGGHEKIGILGSGTSDCCSVCQE